MSLQKQVIFRVLSVQTVWNGVTNSTEVTMSEDTPAADAEPIAVVFRSLGEQDAAQFPSGKRVFIIVGADPAPDKLDPTPSLTAAKGILATAADFIFGS